MSIITDMEIIGFRGIKRLKLDDLCRVNVLLGNNNCGKSSTLEAIMVLLGAAKPSLPLEMNLNRDYSRITNDDVHLFFYNLGEEDKISINAHFNSGHTRRLGISYFESEIIEVPVTESGQELREVHGTFGLDYEYNDDGHKNKSKLKINPNNTVTVVSGVNNIAPNAVFVAPRYNFNDFIKHFNQIVTDKEKDSVLEVLRNVEPRIRDVAVVGDKVMVDIGLQKMVPINVLGDGIRKMFTLIIAMYNARNGILIVDEIDNGLYYKTMSVLWKAMIQSARILNVQLFISTHSLDSLRALNTVLSNDAYSECRTEICIFTLRREAGDTIINYRYDYDKFNYVLNREVEIR